jgi:hypothetical protein
MAGIGTTAWAEATDGVLDARARLRFARAAVATELRRLPAGLRGRLANGGGGHVLDAARLVPDTPLAREVGALAAALVPEPLLGHSLRTWLWASLLAAHDHVDHDDELLYAASLLHDLGLTDDHRTGFPDRSGCFAVDGGRRARALLLERSAPASAADEIAEAITLHMNTTVTLMSGPTAHLLHMGAHLDVVGRRAADLPDAVVAAGVARFPRDGFSSCFTELMRREATERPHSRAGVLWRLGMRVAISRAALPDGPEAAA